jgi:hypothetical protein
MILYGRIISKLVGNENNCRVWPRALSMLEPDEVKVSCPVLRGLGAGNSPRPPDTTPHIFIVGRKKFSAIYKRIYKLSRPQTGRLDYKQLQNIYEKEPEE